MDAAGISEVVSCPNAQCGQQLRIPGGEVLQVTCPTCHTSFTHRPVRKADGQGPAHSLSPEFQRKAWWLAELMLAIAKESVTLIKRHAPSVATNLSRQQEWQTFLEFLKILFNIADRIATFHVAINEYLQFLDAVEDAVIDQMNNAFRKQAGHAYDEVPLKVSIAAAFDAGQKFYRPHRFLITEEGPEKDRYFRAFGEAAATALGTTGHSKVIITASMCANSSIAAIKTLMESAEGHPSSASGHA